jgi:uncharacterized protein YbjT (DUF2867 family)
MPSFLNGNSLISALDPATRLQMIAVENIGLFGAAAFTDAARLSGRSIDLAGDEVTLPEAAATLSRAFGRPIEYTRIPMEEIRKFSEDYALMLEWFDRVGYDANIKALEQEFGVDLLSLDEWATRVAAQQS